MIRKLSTLILCLFLGGCLPVRYISRYPNMGSYEQTHNRIVDRLTSLGWRIFTRPTHTGHIVAAHNETHQSRDVVLIDFDATGDIALWIRTEERLPNGEWLKPETVCENYNWSREQELLAEILRR